MAIRCRERAPSTTSKAALSRCSNTNHVSLDHFVCADQERLRNDASDGFCRLEVDHKLEGRRLLDGYVPRMFATQQFGDRRRYLLVDVLETWTVAGEATLFRAFWKL